MAISRRTRLACLGLAALLLAGAAWMAFHGVSQLGKARAQSRSLQTELARLTEALPLVEQRESMAREAAEFKAQVAKAGLDPAQWANRRVNRTAVAMTRQDAERLMSQQVTGAGQWFAAERFDVAVLAQSAGLFTPAGPGDRGFSIEMSGVVYFPLETK